jgi:methionyl-tRNA formyltransferase
VKQDDTQASFAPKISKSDARIDWLSPAVDIFNLVRGMNPWPGAFTELDGKTMKIYGVKLTSESSGFPAGTIVRTDNEKGVSVVCGDGKLLEITQLMAEGGKRMTAAQYLNGHSVATGSLFQTGGI